MLEVALSLLAIGGLWLLANWISSSKPDLEDSSADNEDDAPLSEGVRQWQDGYDYVIRELEMGQATLERLEWLSNEWKSPEAYARGMRAAVAQERAIRKHFGGPNNG
jgi:hypothetical protein